MFPPDDTIAAIASPPGGAPRGILRLSGPDAKTCAQRVFRPGRADIPVCHTYAASDLAALRAATAVPGALQLPNVASPLPCDLLLWPAGHSYTGQPVAELHALGSPPLLELALGALCRAGARLAQPGEFTLRAFMAGRIDLTQAEAVLGVIDAAGVRQLEAALAQLAGGLATPLRRLRGDLVDLLAHLEAGFDFADEDLPFITPDQLHRQLAGASEAVHRLIKQMACRQETADLARVVLVGWPNTGKSCLFNALLGRTGALVSETPGTTRDYLTAELELDGQVRCLLIDTAGIEEGLGKGLGIGDWGLEKEEDADANSQSPIPARPQSPIPSCPRDSIRRAAQEAAVEQGRLAQVRVLCLDGTRPINAWEERQVAGERGSGTTDWTSVPNPQSPIPNPSSLLVVLTKIDLPQRLMLACPALATSSLTGQGLESLRKELAAAVLAARGCEGEVVAGTAARCGESLRLAAECLHRARQVLSDGGGEELVAAELRVALDELGKVVGAVYADDVLERVFSRFCVGK